MVAYQEFVSLSQSPDSEDRGRAAHLSAIAYLSHHGPADEHAALYAALIGFLDDPSVKVRATLAYVLLHSPEAPRPIILALLHDSAVIARAVLQYSPVLIDADLLGLIQSRDPGLLLAISQRDRISPRLAAAVINCGERPITLQLLRRLDLSLPPVLLSELAGAQGEDAEFRGALLARRDLPADTRLLLVQKVAGALRNCRVVKGSLATERLNRLLRNSEDTAVSSIGEREAVGGPSAYVASLIEGERINTRVLLHAMVTGHVMFFAGCLAELSEVPHDKVLAILERGSRPALHALLSRCGLGQAVGNLIARLVLHARATDLVDDAAARHYVVTALTEELIAEHGGVIPPELEESFAYLSEQNIALARQAARGVMAAFADESSWARALPVPHPEAMALPAA